MITTEQKIMVGKDRLLDDLTDVIDGNEKRFHGYWNFDATGRALVRKLSAILSMPDDSEETLKALDEAGYINGEEENALARWPIRE